MAITFPTTLDALSNPASSDAENINGGHALQHANANDAIEALEAKVGVNSSAVTTSHDYKLSGVTGTDKAVSKTGTETLTNKTLTSPQVNFGSDARGDMIYRNSGGTTSRLAIGASSYILSANASGDPEWIPNPSAADASTTQKGVSEEATQAQVDAGTSADTARLFINPSTLRSKLINDGVVDTGSATAYAIAPTPAITAYAAYQKFMWKAVNSNTTTTPTLAVNGLSVKTIVNPDGTPLSIGQIPVSGIIETVYDGTNMVITSISNRSSKLDAVYTDVTPTADTNENTIYSKSIAGGTLSANNIIRLKIYFDTFTMTSNGTYTLRCKYGSTTLVTLTLASATITNGKGYLEFVLMGSGSVSTQEGTAILFATPDLVTGSGNIATSNGTGTAAENSATALNLVVTSQSQNTGTLSGTLTLRTATLEIIR